MNRHEYYRGKYIMYFLLKLKDFSSKIKQVQKRNVWHSSINEVAYE